MHVLGLTIQGYMSFPKAHVALAVTRYLQGVYEVFTRIQVLPEGTSCTGTCEVLLRSHDGVVEALLLLPPGDHVGNVYGDDDVYVDLDVDDFITFVALIGWGTMRPPVECAEAAEEVGKGR